MLSTYLWSSSYTCLFYFKPWTYLYDQFARINYEHSSLIDDEYLLKSLTQVHTSTRSYCETEVWRESYWR